MTTFYAVTVGNTGDFDALPATESLEDALRTIDVLAKRSPSVELALWVTTPSGMVRALEVCGEHRRVCLEALNVRRSA